jgi:hypothetical protein
MRIWSDSFKNGATIPGHLAFAVKDAATHVRLSANRNPHLAWDEVPNGAESLILFCIDGDAPQDGRDVNKEGRSVLSSVPRGDFYHWTLADIPPSMGSIAEGQFSDGVTPHGKPGPSVANGGSSLRQGLNDYTGWFAADPDMAGDYFGYDGPCPPWNDELVHHYVFRLYALDVARLPLEGRFTGPQAMAAMHGHILDEAQLIGSYTLK